MNTNDAYHLAQRAIADLKGAVYAALESGPENGMRNVDVGRTLGILTGHVRHEGHVPRTILALMEAEGVVQQNPETKTWSLRQHLGDDVEENAG